MSTQNAHVRQQLGVEISRVRVNRGMRTQGALAAAAGVSTRTITAVERGEKVRDVTLRKIEAALDLPAGSIDDYLAGKIGTLTPTDTPTDSASRSGPTTADLAELKAMAAHLRAYAEEVEARVERLMRGNGDRRAG